MSKDHKHSAVIKHVHTRLISSGNVPRTKAPLVNVRASPDYPGCYDVAIIMYLPDYAKNVQMDGKHYPYLDKIKEVNTEAGRVKARRIPIYYDKPDFGDPSCEKPEIYLYSIWEMHIRYQVVGESAQAICVRYTIDDPETPTGPVTSPEKP